MTSRFDNTSEGDQNVGQGEGAIGKQTNIFLPLKPRILVLVIVLLAGIGMGTYYLFAPPAKSLSTQGPATVAGRDAAVSYNYNTNGVDPKLFAHYAGELAVTDAALTNFFRILEEQQVPRNDLDAKLREIAAAHKELLAQVEAIQSKDPEVLRLKDEAKQAVETGRYANAMRLLKKMKEQPFAFTFDLFFKGAPPPPSADR
ncbi:MAG: hypothetical protein V8K32_15350 [Candidatus Electrothrix gigas]